MKSSDASGPRRGFLVFAATIFLGLCLVGLITIASADVILKVTAENPSQLTTQDVAIKSYLPRSIKLEHILETNGLKVGYDVRRSQYYVHGRVSLRPQEKISYQVVLKDIWRVDAALLEEIKEHTDRIVGELGGSDYAEVAFKLQRDINQDAAILLARQEENSMENVGAVAHINAYKLNKELLETIRKKVGVLEKLLEVVAGPRRADRVMGRKRLGSSREARVVRLSAFDGEDVVETGRSEDAFRCLDDQGKEVFLNRAPETVEFLVRVENPSGEMSREVAVRFDLPREVKADDVVDADGLRVGFDFEKRRYNVFARDVPLEPGEKRVFRVRVKNKWVLDREELFALKIHVDNLMKAIEDADAFELTRRLGRDVVRRLLILLQKEPPERFQEEAIEDFRQAREEVDRIRKDVVKIETVLSQAGRMPRVTLVDKQAICDEAKRLGVNLAKIDLRKKGFRNEDLATTGVLAREIRLMAGTIFKGQRLSTASTWKIIQYLVFFLILVSGTFYFTHIRQKQSIMFDPLTGVFTRAYIMDRLKEELRIARGSKNPCSLLILDLDKFKNINDTYGHTVGDAMLKEFAVAIRKGIRATDLVGRFGGDEFLIILPAGDKDVARKVARGVVEGVRRRKIRIGEREFAITTSIGGATFPEDSATAEDLFSKADDALYQTKRSGRDGYTIYGD